MYNEFKKCPFEEIYPYYLLDNRQDYLNIFLRTKPEHCLNTQIYKATRNTADCRINYVDCFQYAYMLCTCVLLDKQAAAHENEYEDALFFKESMKSYVIGCMVYALLRNRNGNPDYVDAFLNKFEEGLEVSAITNGEQLLRDIKAINCPVDIDFSPRGFDERPIAYIVEGYTPLQYGRDMFIRALVNIPQTPERTYELKVRLAQKVAALKSKDFTDEKLVHFLKYYEEYKNDVDECLGLYDEVITTNKQDVNDVPEMPKEKAVNSITPQCERAFRACIVHTEKADDVIALIKRQIEVKDKAGKVALVVRAAMEAGIIERPTVKAFNDAFGMNISKSTFNDYTNLLKERNTDKAYESLIDLFKELK